MTDQLLKQLLLKTLLTGLNDSLKSYALMLHLSKAFHCVDHIILLDKLTFYCTRSNQLDLLNIRLLLNTVCLPLLS